MAERISRLDALDAMRAIRVGSAFDGGNEVALSGAFSDSLENGPPSGAGGDVANFGSSTDAQHGSASLTSTDAGAITDTARGVAQGDQICLYVRTGSAGSPVYFYYGVQNRDNVYFCELDAGNDQLRLGSLVSGQASEIASGAVTLDAATWYKLEIAWRHDGHMTATVFDVGRAAGVVDDFEDGDIAEYTGDTIDFTAQTATVHEGSYAVEYQDDTSSAIRSLTGLDRYPRAGDTFRFWTRTDTDAATVTRFAVQSDTHPPESYLLRVRNDGTPGFFLEKHESGTSTQLASAQPGLSANTWYEVECEWAIDGTLRCTIYDSTGTEVATLSATDTSFSSGGIGFDGHGSGTPTCQWDMVEITSATDELASVSGHDTTYSSGGVGYEATEAGINWDIVEVCGDTPPATGPIDDFEDGGLVEYSTVGGSGTFITQTTTVYEGSTTLQIDAGALEGTYVYSTSGLPRYPRAGDTFQVRFQSPNQAGDTEFAFYWGVQDTDNLYYVRARQDDDQTPYRLTLRKADGGTQTDLADVTYSTKVGDSSWARFVVDWSAGGGMTVALYDSTGSQIAQATATDTAFTSGGVGYGNNWPCDNAGDTHYYDLAEITEAAPPRTGMVDDFEDGDRAEYGHVNSADADGATPTVSSTAPVHEGTYALHHNHDGTDLEYQGMISLDGLPRYPRAGDAFEYKVRLDYADFVSQFWFALQQGNRDDGYFVNLDARSGDPIEFIVRSGGTATTLTSSATTLPAAEWLRVRIEWGAGGTFTITIYDSTGTEVVQLTATDTTYSSGGVGWFSDANGVDAGVVAHDACEITGQAASEATSAVVDGFEDGDIAEYSGDTGTVSLNTSDTENGGYALQNDASAGSFIHSPAGGGLTNYPEAGHTFETYFKFTQTDKEVFVPFGVQDANNYYAVHAYDGADHTFDGQMRIVKVSSGSGTNLASTTSVTVPAGEWLRAVVEWAADGTITYTLYDSTGSQIGSISGTDTAYTSGGFGWKPNNRSAAGVVRMDSAKIL